MFPVPIKPIFNEFPPFSLNPLNLMREAMQYDESDDDGAVAAEPENSGRLSCGRGGFYLYLAVSF